MGDMNARVGVYMPADGRVVGLHGIFTSFVDCCQRYGLVVGGTMFPHKQVHKGTWRSLDAVTVNQIDHIAISSRHRCSLLDVRSLRIADIGVTDHYLVRGKIRVKLSKVSNSRPTRLYDTVKLEDERLQEEFRRDIDEKCHDLNKSDLELQWSK